MIPYLFLSGFLGAGKTTLLNNLLRRYRNLKIGVIVNDFGKLAVDNMLINREEVAGEIMELQAGQIFCSCLSGKFVESVLSYQTIAPDLLLVECSGLAKPATLADIVQVIDNKASGCFDYTGMISVIDGTRHRILEQSLMVVSEQIEASEILLISKTDQLTVDQHQELQSLLESKYPDKIILPTLPDRLDIDIFALLKGRTKAYTQMERTKHAGWGDLGRPTSFTMELPPFSLAQIVATLSPFRQRWYRLKGCLATADQGFQFFDGTQGSLEYRHSTALEQCGLVVITQDSQLKSAMREAFDLPRAPQSIHLAV